MKTSTLQQFNRLRTPLLVALGLTYLGFHTMNGDRGLYALFRETHRQNALEQELAVIQAKREATELKVTHLRSDSLDLDLLDEQARRMLGMIGEDEKLILLEVQ